MITVKDIDKLANLSRMEISDSEKQKIALEIDSILGYVKQVSSFSDFSNNKFDNINSIREDIVTNTKGQFTDDLLSIAPKKDGFYFKVKKILE